MRRHRCVDNLDPSANCSRTRGGVMLWKHLSSQTALEADTVEELHIGATQGRKLGYVYVRNARWWSDQPTPGPPQMGPGRPRKPESRNGVRAVRSSAATEIVCDISVNPVCFPCFISDPSRNSGLRADWASRKRPSLMKAPIIKASADHRCGPVLVRGPGVTWVRCGTTGGLRVCNPCLRKTTWSLRYLDVVCPAPGVKACLSIIESHCLPNGSSQTLAFIPDCAPAKPAQDSKFS